MLINKVFNGPVGFPERFSGKETRFNCGIFVRFLQLIGIAFLIALLPSGNLVLFAENYGDIEVTMEPVSTIDTHHGYFEYRFFVSNHSPTKEFEVDLILPQTTYYYGSGDIREIKRSAIIRPSSSVVMSLWQPPLEMEGSNLSVHIDGYQMGEPLKFRIPNHAAPGYGGAGTKPAVLFSKNSFSGDWERPEDPAAEAALTPSHVKPTRELPYQFLRSDVPITEWSDKWLSLTRFDGMVITSDEISRMKPDVLTTIFRYVETGGCLLVLGPFSPPGSWVPNPSMEEGSKIFNAGFGYCLVASCRDVKSLTDTQKSRAMDFWVSNKGPFSVSRSAEDANRIFPVVEGVGIPVRGLLFLMVCFSVLIGPINLLVLTRLDRKIWILWTVPAFSFLTCIAVFLYAGLGEGWGAHCRIETVTYLDENNQRASTIGWMGYYSPLTIGDGLHLSPDTEVSPQISRYYGSGPATPRKINWSHDQHLSEGWINARVPAHFLVRKNENRRERLMLHRESGGNLSVTNGLGADIEALYLADATGTCYSAMEISSGKPGVLIQSGFIPDDQTGAANSLRSLFQTDWTRNLLQISENYKSYLRPNSYVAILKQAPFVEQGIPNLSSKKSRAAVFGLLKEREQ